jgi:hypothetical protein
MAVAPALADENPFMAVRETDEWAIEQVMQHKSPDDSFTPNGVIRHKKNMAPISIQPVFQAQTFNFQTETDQAKINVAVTDLGGSFIIDVASDQTIQGWLLKRQSTREVFLKGSSPNDNPYKCRIRVERPYLKDFGLTVYVTEDSDPAFVQLF